MTVYARITFEENVIVMNNLVVGTRSRGCLITGVRFELFVIGYPRDLHVNCAYFNGAGAGDSKEVLIRHS